MPVAEWTCYAAALPALRADDTLHDAEAAALPWLSTRDRRRTLTRLRRLAAPHGDLAGPVPDGMAVRRHSTP